MSQKKNRGNYDRIFGLLCGLAFIGVGIGYFGNIMGYWSGFTVFFPGFWAFFIIIPCLAGVIDSGFGSGHTAGLIVGLVCLAFQQNIFVSLRYLVIPTLLVYIGLLIIFKNKPLSYRRILDETGNKTCYIIIPVYRSIFFPKKYEGEKKPFLGAEINTWFAPVTLDLSQTEQNCDACIHINAHFAPVTLIIRGDINLRATKVSGMSNLDVQALNYADIQNAPTLFVNAKCGNLVTVRN